MQVSSTKYQQISSPRYKNDRISASSWMYSKVIRMVQHLHINVIYHIKKRWPAFIFNVEKPKAFLISLGTRQGCPLLSLLLFKYTWFTMMWHHGLDGHVFEQAPGVGDGQGSLVGCSPWDRRRWTRPSGWTELTWYVSFLCTAKWFFFLYYLPLLFIIRYWIYFPVLYRRTLLFIYFIYI